MKNLALIDTERVEELPSRERLLPPDGWRRYGEDYPWAKVRRFLMSRCGKNWNDVFSEYVHLDWVPAQYKTREQIAHVVILHMFLKNGKVWFYDRYLSENERPLEDIDVPERGYIYYFHRDECFYIDPKDFTLRYRHRKISRKKVGDDERRKHTIILGDYHQLLKIDGVWYEVKGKKKERDDVIEHNGLHYREVKHPILPPQSPMDKFFGRKVVPEKHEYTVINGKYYLPDRGEWRYGGREVGPRDRLVSSGGETYYWNRPNYSTVQITLYRQLNTKELKHHGLRNDAKIFRRCPDCGSMNCQINHGKRCGICGNRWCQNPQHCGK